MHATRIAHFPTDDWIPENLCEQPAHRLISWTNLGSGVATSPGTHSTNCAGKVLRSTLNAHTELELA